uniref:Uncharacterized protein n=1 Tax=Ranid herpesvirus 4 TaxID=2849006 RepID=A0A8F3HTD8_9VIRU|nr:MAG: hypothetical protein [Ranid herpesvirus 4]
MAGTDIDDMEFLNAQRVLKPGSYGMIEVNTFCWVWYEVLRMMKNFITSILVLTFVIFTMFTTNEACIWLIHNSHSDDNIDMENVSHLVTQARADKLSGLYIVTLIYGSFISLVLITLMVLSWRHMRRTRILQNNYHIFKYSTHVLILHVIGLLCYIMSWVRAILFIDCSKPDPYTDKCETVAHYGAALTIVFTLVYFLLVGSLGGFVWMTIKYQFNCSEKSTVNAFFNIRENGKGIQLFNKPPANDMTTTYNYVPPGETPVSVRKNTFLL